MKNQKELKFTKGDFVKYLGKDAFIQAIQKDSQGRYWYKVKYYTTPGGSVNSVSFAHPNDVTD